jgi:anti-anti-sigma regulatory factor
VDLTACTFLDSAGLAAITIAVARARAWGGELMIAATDGLDDSVAETAH